MARKKSAKQQKVALKELIETAEFWLPIFEQEALNCVDRSCSYGNPWFPVEFARRVKELAEIVAGDEK